MKYKVGDKLKLKIYKNKLYLKKEKLNKDQYLEEDFLIISINQKLQYYTVLVHDYMVGWNINQFHILNCDVDPKFFGKRFYDVFESQL